MGPHESGLGHEVLRIQGMKAFLGAGQVPMRMRFDTVKPSSMSSCSLLTSKVRPCGSTCSVKDTSWDLHQMWLPELELFRLQEPAPDINFLALQINWLWIFCYSSTRWMKMGGFMTFHEIMRFVLVFVCPSLLPLRYQRGGREVCSSLHFGGPHFAIRHLCWFMRLTGEAIDARDQDLNTWDFGRTCNLFSESQHPWIPQLSIEHGLLC